MMQRTTLFLAVLWMVAAGCGPGETDPDGDGPSTIGVIVSLLPQQQMAEAIGGERIAVTVMVPPGQSPHSYEPTPGQLVAVSNAELYFSVGSGVEFEIKNLELLQQQNPTMTVIDGHVGVELLSLDGGAECSEEHGPDGEHHHHGSTDPHIWLDAANARIMADNLLAGLILVDPDHAAVYRTNRDQWVTALEETDTRIRGLLNVYQGKPFLTYHPAWGYFARAYGLRQIAVEDGGRQPGPVGVAQVIEQAREAGILVVIASPQYDTSSAQVIASEIGGIVLTLDPLAATFEESALKAANGLANGFEGPGPAAKPSTVDRPPTDR